MKLELVSAECCCYWSNAELWLCKAPAHLCSRSKQQKYSCSKNYSSCSLLVEFSIFQSLLENSTTLPLLWFCVWIGFLGTWCVFQELVCIRDGQQRQLADCSSCALQQADAAKSMSVSGTVSATLALCTKDFCIFRCAEDPCIAKQVMPGKLSIGGYLHPL